MRTKQWIWAATALLLVACSNKSARDGATAAAIVAPDGKAAAAGMHAPAGMFLAYEHSATIRLAGQEIPARIVAVQASCLAQTFGDCVVLNVERRGGDNPSGSLTVRIAPKGVEPLIQQAGKGGEFGERSTRAEDLAQAVLDTTLQHDRLEKEHARLLEFESRPNLAVADMLVLSTQLADVESRIEATKRDAAQHQLRIDTNLLTMEFQTPNGESGRSDIGQAVHDFGHTVAESSAFVIRAFAALMPLIIVFGGLVVLWRWRRRKRKAGS